MTARTNPGLLVPGVEQRAIPNTLFGMHVIGLGAHEAWPTVPFGFYRLSDATPRWHSLHVAKDSWYTDDTRGAGLARLRYILHMRDRKAAATPVLYTLGGGPDGGFPAWLKLARSRADTVQAWREHVSSLATQFRGQIKHWEIWNEFDCACFYRGSIDLMVQLTRAAREELLAVDARNVIVSPAVTGNGLKQLAAFLAAGGGQYVDVIAWHPNLPARPESYLPTLFAVRELMHAYSVEHLPLWATEGHPAAEDGVDPAAIVVRSYILLWATGHVNFNWYAWDVTDYDMPGEWVTLTKDGRPDQQAPAAIGYRKAFEWLVGRRVVSLRAVEDTWIAELESTTSQGPAWIVWAAGPDVYPFRIPIYAHALHRLNGATEPVRPGSDYMPEPSPALITSH